MDNLSNGFLSCPSLHTLLPCSSSHWPTFIKVPPWYIHAVQHDALKSLALMLRRERNSSFGNVFRISNASRFPPLDKQMHLKPPYGALSAHISMQKPSAAGLKPIKGELSYWITGSVINRNLLIHVPATFSDFQKKVPVSMGNKKNNNKRYNREIVKQASCYINDARPPAWTSSSTLAGTLAFI